MFSVLLKDLFYTTEKRSIHNVAGDKTLSVFAETNHELVKSGFETAIK